MNERVHRKKNPLVGVRELRQNLSVYLDRVKAGETLKVTERGYVVAILAPLPAAKLSALEQVVAAGRGTAPVRSLTSLPRPRPAADSVRAEDIISAGREERL